MRKPFQVTDAKLVETQRIVDGMLQGDHMAAGKFKEYVTTGSDFIFSFTHLLNTQVLALYPEAPRVWDQIATVKAYPTFEAPKLYTTVSQISGLERPVDEPGKPGDVAPIVPESSPYPHFIFSGELLEGGRLHKRGAKFSLSWEQIVSDAENLVPQIPGMITRTFLEAEEWEVFSTLKASVGATQALKPGTNLDGTTVVANAPLSREALMQAVAQLKNRKINDRKVVLTGGFTLVVPIGAADQANYILHTLQLSEITDGNLKFAPAGFNPLTSITKVVESEYVTDQSWYLLPAKGSTIRPVIELMKLQGHESIDLRVENATGSPIGGSGSVGPFEGSYDTDDASMRGRYPITGANWTPDLVIWSNGTGKP